MAKYAKLTRRFTEQYWLIDKVIQTTGPDICFPMSGIAFGAVGPDVAGDIMAIRANIRKYPDITREYARVAVKREGMAKKAESEGHLVTARDCYFAAAIFYSMAVWPIHEDGNKTNIALSAKKNECYDKFIKYAERPIERVEIPLDGKSMAGLLHLPPDRSGKVPCVLDMTGMDGCKESQNPHYGEKHLQRGMAVLALDIPGQGESLLRDIRYSMDSVARAGRATMDFLVKHPAIDPNKIAVSGISSGTLSAVQMAASDDRYKAVAGRLFCHEPGFHHLFNVTQPAYKARYMWMAGYDDEDEFDKFAQTLTPKGLGAKLKCPFLAVGGEDDEISPIEYSYDLFNEVKTPKKMVVYEGQLHSLHSCFMDAVSIVTDWLRDRFDGKPAVPEEIIYIDRMGQEKKR